jgi:hypothetical protein
LLFAATDTHTVPLPTPDALLETVAQSRLLDAVQAQPLGATTENSRTVEP